MSQILLDFFWNGNKIFNRICFLHLFFSMSTLKLFLMINKYIGMYIFYVISWLYYVEDYFDWVFQCQISSGVLILPLN